MSGSLACCESKHGEKRKAPMPQGSETNLSRKREASTGLGLPPSTLAEALGSASEQKRRQTSHGGLACWQSAQAPSEGSAVLLDINEPSSPPRHSLLQVSYGPSTCSSAQPAEDAAAASTAFGFMRQLTQTKGHLSEHWSNGVSAAANCFAFQHVAMDFMSADNNWLQPSDTIPQKDCPHPTPVLSANAFTLPLPSPPSSPTARPLDPLQHAVTAAEGEQTFAQRQSGCLALKHSSQTIAPSAVGTHDAVTNQHQQQQTGTTAAVDPRLFSGGGFHGSVNRQEPLGQGRAPALYSTGAAPFSRGWTCVQAPSPSPSPGPSPTPAFNQGSCGTIYQFQGSSSTEGGQDSSTSQVGVPHPPMGITPPSSNPAVAPAMQPYTAGASPGTAPSQSQQQQQQEQEQHILTKMQQCMVSLQKMQQLLQTGRNVASQPLTDEVRERYQGQGNAVAAQYNRLLAQYNMLRQGVGCTQGAVEGAPPPALRDPDFPPDPAGQAFPPGQNARRRYRGGVADADADAGAVADADADAVADDYDRELQAALVASVTNQPGKWVIAPTHLTDMGPEEKPGEKGPAATCPLRAVPCNALAAEEAAQVDEITRLTAEPLMMRAQNGGGVVWQNEKDTSVPKGDPPTQTTRPTPQQYAQGAAVLPDTAAKAETTLVSAAAAALPVPASAEASADSIPGGSHADSDLCAEKVAELSLEANPAGLQLAKDMKEEEEDLSLLKALSKKELQAYGPQSESGYTSGDLCEDVHELDICDGGSEASEGAVSDTCSEEQEDFQAVRLAADEEAASKAGEDAQLQDDWVLTEADGPEWI